jgi:hypothetical protein
MERREFLLGSLAACASQQIGAAASVNSPAADDTQSPPVTGVTVGTPVKFAGNSGDTWIAAWADDDNLYSPSDDSSGFQAGRGSNVAFNRLSGADPLRLTGATVNSMADYGAEGQEGPDGCTWKSTGCLWIDGALYLSVGRHLYGEQSADPNRRQTAQNASIIKSTDLGKTWTRTAQQNYDTPMFPGRRFATPYFIQYGYGHADVSADGANEYVYATSNNGFWDCGDDMVLARVPRAKLGLLSPHDWEFYRGGDGMLASAWTAKMADARQILVAPGKVGMTGAVYLAAQRRYFMVGWYYPAGGGKMPDAGTHTVWAFYESPRPWGPWAQIGSYDSTPAGLYSPEICPKFQDGNRIYAITAGYWGSSPDYRLTIVPLELATGQG